jgi:hypothetical protein
LSHKCDIHDFSSNHLLLVPVIYHILWPFSLLYDFVGLWITVWYISMNIIRVHSSSGMSGRPVSVSVSVEGQMGDKGVSGLLYTRECRGLHRWILRVSFMSC